MTFYRAASNHSASPHGDCGSVKSFNVLHIALIWGTIVLTTKRREWLASSPQVVLRRIYTKATVRAIAGVKLGATKAPPVLAAKNRPRGLRHEVSMVEFFRRLFTPHNLYCMSVCGVFLVVWFYISREQQTHTVDPLGRRRRREGPSVGQSS